MTETTLSMTGNQYRALKAHLLSADGKEGVAIALCGRRAGKRRHRLLVHSLRLIPYDQCEPRTATTVAWLTDLMIPWLQEADRRGSSIVKIHSHRADLRKFSQQDDLSDVELFPCIADWIEQALPHASAVMLPDGRMFGRAFVEGAFRPLDSISVVGDDLSIWHAREFAEDAPVSIPAFAKRHAQAFGETTTRRLRLLSAAVIGCSGTGSVVIEQLVRLGIGRLVLVDGDVVKELNLNRILNAIAADADAGRPKVDVIADAIERIGLGTLVDRYATELTTADAVLAVAECDVVFGCVDTAEGRFIANLLASFYILPFIDVGVALDADEDGAITQVCGYVQYLQPDGSSLISRGAISMEDVRAEGLRRQNPEYYASQRRAGYIRNVAEDRPAVISVNMVLAGMAVNELLARIHGFRDEPNSDYATIGMSISQIQFYPEPETGIPCRIMAKHVGRGDVEPLLDQAELSREVTP
jgi:ThiF family/Prokaryotic homologs of the JAB domain